MKKTITKILIITALVILGYNNLIAQNIYSLDTVKIVGAMNSYDTSSNSNTTYRRLSTTSGNPTDGRGQWVKTYNVQSSGGNFVPVNMTGGTNNGFLFISGPATNRFANKWTFSGTGSAALNTVNSITSYSNSGGGTDMGLNMLSAGRYTFVFNDAGYTNTNSKFYVAYTAATPVSISSVSQIVNSNRTATINITTSATPSSGENIYVRYTTSADFSSSNTSFIVQASGSGSNWTATIPVQNFGTTIKYYVFTSTASSISSMSEIDKSLVALNYNDNAGANYTYNITQKGISRVNTLTPVICGTSTNYTVSIIGTDTFSSPYQWQFINSNDSTLSATNDVTIQNLGNKIQSIQYKLWRRISRAGTTNPDTSNWVLVSMNTPTLTNSNTTTICRGSSPNLTLTANTPSTFAWTLGTNTGSISGASASSGSSINQTLINPSNANVGSIIYNVTPTSTVGSCVGSVTAIAVTVNPRPLMISSTSQTVCSGISSSVALTASTSGGSNSFAWSTIGNSNLSGFSTSGSSSTLGTHTIINNANNTQTLTYNITPTFTYNGTSCPGPSSNHIYTINPRPNYLSFTDTTICSGTTLNFNMSSYTTGTNFYTWKTYQVQNISGNNPLVDSAFSLSRILTNNDSTTKTVTYKILAKNTQTGQPSCYATDSITINIYVNPRPIMTSSTSQTVCSGVTSSVPLRASTSGGTNSFSWITNGNWNLRNYILIGTSDTIGPQTITDTASISQPLVYSITPTFTYNSVSCAGTSANHSYTINPSPIVTNPVIRSICSGASTNLTLTSNIPSTFSWTLGTIQNNGPIIGGSAGNGASINQTLTNPSDSNTASVLYIVTPTSSLNSCVGNPKSIFANVYPIPVVTNSNALGICNGTSTNLALSASTPSSFAWTLGTSSSAITGASASNGLSINQILTNTSNSNAGNVVYNITPTSTANYCVGNSLPITISVIPRPQYNGDRTQNICSGKLTNLLLSSTTTGGLNTFTFTSGIVNGITGNLSDSSINSIAQNLVSSNSIPTWVKYNVTPKFIYNSVSCAGSSVIDSVLVNPLPIPVITAPNAVCAKSTNSISTSNDSNKVFIWGILGGNIISGQGTSNINVNWGSMSNATVLLKDSLKITGCVATESKDISISPLPNSLFTFTQSQGNLTFTPQQSGLSYKWYFGDGDSSSVQNPVHNYKTNGNYLVKLNVLNANSCENDTTITVSVNTVGVNNIGKMESNIAIYPNPSSGIFTISSNQLIANINVFDVTGKFVHSQQNNGNKTVIEIDLSALSNGIYFIHTKTENGEVSKSKVVVSK